MRIVIFSLIVLLALSGCANSGVSMYSVPTQSRSYMRSQNSQVTGQPLAYKAPVSKREQEKQYSSQPKKQNKPNQKSKPNRKKKSGKNKGILNEAMGVSYKLAKDAIRYIKPKLPKIPGF